MTRRLAPLLLASGLTTSVTAAGCSLSMPWRGPAASPSSAKDDTGQHPLDVDHGICLNELMPANRSVLLRDDGSSPDWIELFNPTEVDVDLGRFGLSDDREDRAEHLLPAGLVLPAGEALVLYAVGDDDTGTVLAEDELPFRLSAEGGEVVLFEPDGDGQVVVYGAVEQDFSIARSTDCCTGEGCLTHRFRGSPGKSND